MGAKTKTKKDKQDARRQNKKNANPDQEIDAETAVQVQEIQDRLQMLSAEMNQVDSKIRFCNIEAQRAALTGKQVHEVPDDTSMYRQVGKMFMKVKKQDLATSLQGQNALKSVEKKQLEQRRTALEQLARSEGLALRELIGEKKMKQMFDGGETKEFELPGSNSGADAVMPIWGTSAKSAAGASGSAGDEAADRGVAETAAAMDDGDTKA